MYAGPFVAAWEKIVDIRSILREGAFMFGKKIAILLSTAMILTGSCVSSVAVHAQTGYAAEYAQNSPTHYAAYQYCNENNSGYGTL